MRNAARTTIRLLESLIRLAQAHARLMYREVVTTQDAVVAVTCVECSMQNTALLGAMNALHTRFPDDPAEEYTRQAQLVLGKLGLEDMTEHIHDCDDDQQLTSGDAFESNGGSRLESGFDWRTKNVPEAEQSFDGNVAGKKDLSSRSVELTDDSGLSSSHMSLTHAPLASTAETSMTISGSSSTNNSRAVTSNESVLRRPSENFANDRADTELIEPPEKRPCFGVNSAGTSSKEARESRTFPDQNGNNRHSETEAKESDVVTTGVEESSGVRANLGTSRGLSGTSVNTAMSELRNGGKSNELFELFKKPQGLTQNSLGASGQQTANRSYLQRGSIFVTEELKDEDLELDDYLFPDARGKEAV